jgi:hypothetical protein
MSDDGRPAVFVGTMLETGDAVALCDECLVPWTAAVLHALTGIDPTPFLEAVSEVEPAVAVSEDGAERIRAAAEGGEQDPPTPIRPDGRSSGESGDPGTATDPEQAEPTVESDAPPSAA